MQHNVIKNQPSPGLPGVKGPQMNDRDRLNDVLASEKYLTGNLNTFATEASHRALHQDVMMMLNETHMCTRDLFNLMFQKGWYKLQAEPAQQMQQSHQQFQGYQTQFPYGSNMMQ